MNTHDQQNKLRQAITALETQRSILGDVAVDAAIVGIQQQLATLAAPEPVRQRKQVTVMFADVSGFTAMSETLDPEAVHEIINAVWTELDRVINEHGGMIDKHYGDGVMALWGVDVIREDDPEWAIRAALVMQREVSNLEARIQSLSTQLNLDTSPTIRIRIGISTGAALLGDVVTTGEFSIIGDTVNLAARLQQMAPISGILIAHHTYRHVRGVFTVQAQPPMKLKGKTDPVQTYLVLHAKPRTFRMRTRGIEGIETQMVGRDAELHALQRAFHAATDNARTHIVTVVGEAGVGKSRLLYEFGNWLDLLQQQIYFLKGRATPEMQTMPHGIIRDMFTYRFDIRESDSATTVLGKFRAGMQDYVTQAQADLIGQMIGFDFQRGSQPVQKLLGSSAFRTSAQADLVKYIRAITHRPTVIFLEDIHWADDGSLDLLTTLINTVPKSPLLVVYLARHSLFERRPNWGCLTEDSQRGPICLRVPLSPLSKTDSRNLVAQILQKLDNIPPALSDLIVSGAEGNPYYVEELIKMLIEDGVIVRDGEHWHTASTHLHLVQVPTTLTGILQARLDSLPRAERDLLQRASVVGRLFWDAAVSELMEDCILPEQHHSIDVDEQERIKLLLDAVRERELIFRRPTSSFQGTQEYIFKHAILRDVTYETVLLKVRQAYHARVARWLENHARERMGEYQGLIAGHYELAGEHNKAADYLMQSGMALRVISAYHDAIAAFKRVLELQPEENLTQRAQVYTQLGYAYRQTSDYPAATQHLERGLSLARQAQDAPTEVSALNGLGWTQMTQGKYDSAKRHLLQALKLGRKIQHRAGVALATHHLGDIAYRQGHSDEAAKYAWECLALYRGLNDQPGIAGAFRILGFVSYMREQYADAVRHHQESLRIYTEIGDRWGMGTGHINLGESMRRQRHFAQAATYYEKSLPLFQEIGNHFGIAVASLNLGHAYNGMNDLARAEHYFRRTMVKAHDLGSVALVLECMMGYAWVSAKHTHAQRAAELVGMVQHHPDYNAEIAQFVAPILSLARDQLNEPQIATALTHGATLNLDAVIADLGIAIE